MNINDFKTQKEQLVIVDTRGRNSFLEGFIPKSIYLPIKKFALLPLIIKEDEQIVFVIDENNDQEVIDAYKLLKLPNEAEILEGGMISWETQSWGKDLLIDIEADEFAMDYKFDQNLLLIDVRKEDDFNEAHIAGAQNMPLSTFGDVLTIANINDDQNVYIHCGGGDSAVVAASLLKRQGLHNVRVILDGFDAMTQQHGVEIVTAKQKNN